MSTSIDHRALAISRLTTQFRESPNLISYIETLLVEAQRVEDLFHEVVTSRYLDTAIGAQLDILGLLVGQLRVFIDDGMGGTVQLTDDEYRAFIRARIATNNSINTPEAVISTLDFLFDGAAVIYDETVAGYTIAIGKVLTDADRLLLENNLIPRPAGVGVAYLAAFNPDGFFAFQGVAGNVLGFGTLIDGSIGGTLAELI